jgi:hypothetical protein
VNTGGTIYSSVQSSTFGSGITTIVVSNDTGVLDSGLSVVSYGPDAINVSAPAASLVLVQVVGGAGSIVTATPFQVGITANTSNTKQLDTLNEYTVADGHFTPKRKGRYAVNVTVTLGTTSTTFTANGAFLFAFKDGINYFGCVPVYFPTPVGAGTQTTAVLTGFVDMVVSDYLTFGVQCAFTGTAPTINASLISVVRQGV